MKAAISVEGVSDCQYPRSLALLDAAQAKGLALVPTIRDDQGSRERGTVARG